MKRTSVGFGAIHIVLLSAGSILFSGQTACGPTSASDAAASDDAAWTCGGHRRWQGSCVQASPDCTTRSARESDRRCRRQRLDDPRRRSRSRRTGPSTPSRPTSSSSSIKAAAFTRRRPTRIPAGTTSGGSGQAPAGRGPTASPIRAVAVVAVAAVPLMAVSVMAAAPCAPTTCSELGLSCGPASDGCGGTLDCGMCTAPATCGGGGTPGVCGGGSGSCLPPPLCSATGVQLLPGDVLQAAIDANPEGTTFVLAAGTVARPEHHFDEVQRSVRRRLQRRNRPHGG